jgi:hypothetical protein
MGAYSYAVDAPVLWGDPLGLWVDVRRRPKHGRFWQLLGLKHCYLLVGWDELEPTTCGGSKTSSFVCRLEVGTPGGGSCKGKAGVVMTCTKDGEPTEDRWPPYPLYREEYDIVLLASVTPVDWTLCHNCCHWAREVWEGVGRDWPWKHFNWWLN